jgi:leader peptidase (prepilin peptidase)/N-methyltransferase
MDWLPYVFPALVLFWLFVMGCAVGSFLNVCLYRLPRGKNLLWPSSRCGACLQPIPLYLNVPLFAWWWLRGRCRRCGASFSMRYFWIELLTGLVVVGLYTLEIGFNVHHLPVWGSGGFDSLFVGHFPSHAWPFIAFHAALAALLIVAAGCLLEHQTLPRALIVSGAVLGMTWALLYPWPEPVRATWLRLDETRPGFTPAPVWAPLPDWLQPGSLGLGLAGGAAGILGPAWLLRLVNHLVRQRLGPADRLLVMTGGFLGWQPLVVALALAGVLAVVAGLVRRLRSPSPRWGEGRKTLFPLLLVAALVASWLGWAWLAPLVLPFLFDPVGLAASLVGLVGLLAGAALLGPDRPAKEVNRPAAAPPAGG